MWRPRTPVLELFPCSQNSVALFLLAHWHGIAWLWSILFFPLTLPLQQPSAGSEHLQWYPPSECVCPADVGAKLDCMWSLTSCSCCAQVLLNSPLLKVLLLWAQNKKERSLLSVNTLSPHPILSVAGLCHAVLDQFFHQYPSRAIFEDHFWTSSWFQMWGSNPGCEDLWPTI